MEIIAIQHQSLLDIALQYLGDITGVFTLASLNGISVTGEISPGQVIKVPDRAINKRVRDYYNGHRVTPATADFDSKPARVFSREFTLEYS